MGRNKVHGNLVPVHFMNGYRGRDVERLTSRCTYFSSRKENHFSLNRKLCGTQSPSGTLGEGPFIPTRIGIQDRVERSLVATPTTSHDTIYTFISLLNFWRRNYFFHFSTPVYKM